MDWGSQKGLDVASMIAIEEFRNYMTANLKSDKIEDIEKEAKTAMYLMNKIIFAYQKMDS